MGNATKETIIVWFRQDLRLSDNPALHYAVKTGASIIPIYILDDENADKGKLGGATRWWLHHSLNKLNESLSGNLQFYNGKADDILPSILKETDAQAVYWNRCYEPWRIARDKQIKADLEERNINVESFQASLLWEPWTVLKDDKTPYKVFSPYYKRGCLIRSEQPRAPYPKPKAINFSNTTSATTLDDLSLLPTDVRWDKKMEAHWVIGEEGAQQRLHDFLDEGLLNYKDGRNEPSKPNVSRLSPHLRHGEISPHQAWHAVQERGTIEGWERDRDHFLSELGWREFSYYLLYHFPTITWENLQTRFDNFPWITEDSEDLDRWRHGQTGYPIVDAGMRELWQTGSMHNRLRMIVGSFLVKNMLTHWHKGEEWFWDTLVDADLASNNASWQWIAGCGADAAPYFRIFNPILQSKKFDGAGEYIRKYCPELAKLPDKHLHEPWDAPDNVLEYAGVKLGETYPERMMAHSDARDRALAAFQSTKK